MKQGVVIIPYLDINFGQTVNIIDEDDLMYRVIPHGDEGVLVDYIPRENVLADSEVFDYQNKKSSIYV